MSAKDDHEDAIAWVRDRELSMDGKAFAREMREKASRERATNRMDSEVAKIMSRATSVWFIVRQSRSEPPTTTNTDVVGWCENEHIVDAMIKELRGQNRNPPTLARATYESRSIYMKREAPYAGIMTAQAALEMCERFVEEWSRRSEMLKQAIEEHERTKR